MSQNEQDERQRQFEQEGEALLIKGRVTKLEGEQEEAQKRDEEYKKLQILYNKRVAWFTLGLVFTSLVTNVVYLDMSCTARKSAESARIAAVASAEASSTAAKALKDSETSFTQTLGQMQAQTRAQEGAAGATKNAAAAKSAADIAGHTLNISQQSYVTIGRQDGTVAEIVWPKEPEGNAGVVVYFQNTGHLPAKFNWGNDSPMIAVLPADPSIVKEPMGAKWSEFPTDHFFQPMWRAKNRKTGAISYSGSVTIGGNSTYAGTLWELPKERMIQLQNWDRPFTVDGTFEYCDSFHNYVCRKFYLLYRREPYNRFVLVSEDECAGFLTAILHHDRDLDYMSPCVTGTEREETSVPKGLFAPKH
ncbi:MAG: hypothetical protein ABSD38_37130 [Syntrophorhabdales bacterium]|jgi:hypothetical protein